MDVWYYDLSDSGPVAIASYLARQADNSALTPSGEHGKLAYFAVDRINALTLPDGYKETILSAYGLVRSQT